jgi:hypothetical protein
MYILAYILYYWYMYPTRVCSRAHLLAYLCLDRTYVPIHDPLFYLHFLCVSKQTLHRYPCNMIDPAKQEYLDSGAKTACPMHMILFYVTIFIVHSVIRVVS